MEKPVDYTLLGRAVALLMEAASFGQEPIERCRYDGDELRSLERMAVVGIVRLDGSKYVLSREPESITLLEIAQAVDGVHLLDALCKSAGRFGDIVADGFREITLERIMDLTSPKRPTWGDVGFLSKVTGRSPEQTLESLERISGEKISVPC